MLSLLRRRVPSSFRKPSPRRPSSRRKQLLPLKLRQRPPRLNKLLAEALEHLVRGIVDSPDDVKVSAKNNRRGETLEVRVHQDDLGRVIGRQGRTARALRTVVAALAGA